MDQESGRRRSSRLAARGVVLTPRAEAAVKKTLKSSEKPKRTKRKTTEEEIIELPEAKKSKSETKTIPDEVDEPANIKTIEKNDISDVEPIDENDKKEDIKKDDIKNDDIKKEDIKKDDIKKDDIKKEDEDDKKEDINKEDIKKEDIKKEDIKKEDIKKEDIKKEDIKKEDDKNEDNKKVEDKLEDNEEEFIQDSSEQVVELLVSNEEKEKVLLVTEDIPKSSEEPMEEETPEVIEPEKNDIPQEEPKPETVLLENTNGKNDDDNTVKEVEVLNKDIGFCVTKNTVTPNGDTDVQVKSTNGEEKKITEIDALEPIKVLNDNTNHVAETDLKTVTITESITASIKDESSVEQIEKEQDTVADDITDTVNVSADDNGTPKVDQSPTVMS